MKSFFLTLIAVLFTASIFAQAPEKMSYQAVIRDATNALQTNAAIGMQISLLQGSASGTAVYVETHAATTNDNGLVSIEIGDGTVISGDFASIDWTAGPYFVKTETDPDGGTNYSISGTSQLLSTPYALYAKTSGSSTPGPEGPQGPQGPQGPEGPQGPQGPEGLLPNGSASGNTPYWDGSAWVTNSSNIFNDGGNVGIGTSSPDARLDVYPDFNVAGIQILETQSTQTGKTINLGSNGALVFVNFYTQCQNTSAGGILYINANNGHVTVMSTAGTTSASLTATNNVLSITNLCQVTFDVTFNVTNGVATLVPGGGFFTLANWIVLPG